MSLSQQSQWMESYILVKHVDGRYLHGASMVIWLHYICGLDFQDAYAIVQVLKFYTFESLFLSIAGCRL